MQGDFDLETGTRSRFLTAILAFALALFLLALAFGIVSAPIHGHPVLAALLKGFILLLFGAIAAGALFSGARALSGASGEAHRVPDEALAHCLTCGERAPNDDVCPSCDEPPCDRARSFTVVRPGWAGSAFGVALFGALVCLGVFVLVGPWHDGERRPWALLAFGALALLLLAVGGAGVVGSLLALRDGLGGLSRLAYTVSGTERQASGSGGAVWGKLVWLWGRGRVVSPLSPLPANEGGYRVSPGDITFAEMVATLDAAGLVQIEDVTTYHFRLGEEPAEGARPRARGKAPLPFSRTKHRAVCIQLSPLVDYAATPDEFDDGLSDVIPRDDLLAPGGREDMRRFFARYLLQPLDLQQFRTRLDDDPVHRAQALAHARALREGGVLVAQELVDAILGGLRDAKASPPL